MMSKNLVAVFFALLKSTMADENTCAYIDFLGKDHGIDELPCSNHTVCKKTFKISYIEFPPYFYRGMANKEVKDIDHKLQKPIQRRLRLCCGKCVQFEEDTVFNSIADVSLEAMNSSDFIYPFFASSSTNMLYGYHYLPVMDIPKLIYVTKKKEAHVGQIVEKVLPLTLICILMAALAGFVCWAVETWKNEDEFQRPFLIGWFEGFWWSFISMTTVGYGDKTPRSFLGRVFSVLWISIGIIAYGLLTGVVYNKVNQVNSPPLPKMQDSKVGCLLYRDYDAFLVAENGGEVLFNDWLINISQRKCEGMNLNQSICSAKQQNIFTLDVLHLLERLKEDKLDGLALDQYTLWLLTEWISGLRKDEGDHLQFFETNWVDSKDVLTFLKDTVTTAVESAGAEQYTYGALVKHSEDFNFFRDFIKDNRLRDRAYASILWSKKKAHVTRKEEHNTLFSYRSETFKWTIKFVLGITAFIVLIGITCDLHRTKGDIKAIFGARVGSVRPKSEKHFVFCGKGEHDLAESTY